MLQLAKLVTAAEWVDARTVVTQCGKMVVLPSTEPIKRSHAPTVLARMGHESGYATEATIELIATVDLVAGTRLCLGDELFPLLRRSNLHK